MAGHSDTDINMTAASCWRVCRIFRKCVSTAEFLRYWSRQAVYYNGKRSISHWYCIKAISIAYSECASVALVIQHAHRIFSFRITLSSVTHRTLQYLLTLSHKRYKFWNRFFNYYCVLIFPTNFVWNISIVRRIQPDIIINVQTSSCKVLATLLTVQSELNFVDKF